MGNLSGLQQVGIASAGVGIVGSAVQGFGKYETGQQQRHAYDYNAAIALQQMQQAEQTTEAEFTSLTGKEATHYAKAGVDIASGSPLLIMAHTAAQKSKEEQSQAEAGDEQAALDKYYGKVAAFNGTIGGIDDFLSGAAKGAGQIASILT